jgi:hypothetical protein
MLQRFRSEHALLFQCAATTEHLDAIYEFPDGTPERIFERLRFRCSAVRWMEESVQAETVQRAFDTTLKANDSIPSISDCSPVVRFVNPSLFWMGFLSFRSFSCCASEYPIVYATHRLSADNTGCDPKAMGFRDSPAAYSGDVNRAFRRM